MVTMRCHFVCVTFDVLEIQLNCWMIPSCHYSNSQPLWSCMRTLWAVLSYAYSVRSGACETMSLSCKLDTGCLHYSQICAIFLIVYNVSIYFIHIAKCFSLVLCVKISKKWIIIDFNGEAIVWSFKRSELSGNPSWHAWSRQSYIWLRLLLLPLSNHLTVLSALILW